MKNRKWLTYTLGALLTLVVLGAVAGVSFRAGMMRNASFIRPAFAHNFNGGPQAMMPGNFQNNGGPQAMQRNFRDNGGPQWMQGDPRNQGFYNHGNNRGGDRRGGGRFSSPIFGLIHLALLGLLLWVVYKLVKNSGWRLTRVTASTTPTTSTPSGTETPNAAADAKKESE